MYRPSLFREDRPEILQAFIRSHPLGLLISVAASGLNANLLPFHLRPAVGGQHDTLQAHMARANPQWRELHDEEVLVVFRGPDAYVSPSLYPTKRETGRVVPTWNYVMVQARGRARIMDDSEWLARHLEALTASQEATRPEPWSPTDAPADYIEERMRAIIGIEIDVDGLEGKWKVSQNQPDANQIAVAAAFDQDPMTREMAELVRRRGKPR